ncbi:MAG: FMN-binding negative transcriptional regulator [Ilumatobacter sp.]|uniref:FMN-binding negative transcriptional regulator n=1 Tax=Ilumatobacter sp. TaxID=1967498 RepID=UPI0032995108
MYTPEAFEMATGPAVTDVLRSAGFGHLVSHSDDADGGSGLLATALPFVVDDDISRLRAHVARANPHWGHVDGHHALLIVPTVDAYVSPRWFASTAEHGRVVPTSNYELVHLHGVVEIHHDAEWKRRLVDDLTRENESRVDDPESAEPWSVSDAPASYIDARLEAIVGIELHVQRVEAKQKLSQNRSEQDRLGVTDGLGRSRDHGATDISDRMRERRG